MFTKNQYINVISFMIILLINNLFLFKFSVIYVSQTFMVNILYTVLSLIFITIAWGGDYPPSYKV
jgi:hypothetical protein